MAMDLTGANNYFDAKNHSRSAIWTGFADESPDQQNAALAEAERTLCRVMGRILAEPTDPTDLTEVPRDDYALFEQALFILENGYSVGDSKQPAAAFIAGRTKLDDARERSTDTIAPAALQWLFRGRVRMLRG